MLASMKDKFPNLSDLMFIPPALYKVQLALLSVEGMKECPGSQGDKESAKISWLPGCLGP